MYMIWIVLGGALGALIRFSMYLAQVRLFPQTWPSTLTINILGCFGLGVCFSMYKVGYLQETGRFFWMIGFWASFTTFSTFAMDMFDLMQKGQNKTLVGYILASVLLGFIFFVWGHKTHQTFFKTKDVPVNKTAQTNLTKFGITRTDEHAWVRDKNNPKVIKLLAQENKKTDAYFANFKDLQDDLYTEMISRINEDDTSYPYTHGAYQYYAKISKGENYKKYYRKKSGTEELLLDLNEIGKDQSFVSLAAYEISPSHNLLAYSLDFDGSEIYTIFIKDLETGTVIESSIKDATGSIEWGSNDNTLLYAKMDDTHRPYQIHHHTVGKDPSTDTLVFQDDDLSNYVGFYKTRSERFIFINADSKLSSEVFYIDLAKDEKKVTPFAPRKEKVLLHVDHHEENFVIHTNEDAVDFKLLTTNMEKISSEHWTEVIAHQEGRFIEDVSIFKNFWILWERHQGNQTLRMYNPIEKNFFAIDFQEPAFSLSGETNAQYDTTVYRYGYSSMKTPYSVMEFDTASQKNNTLQVKEVPGSFNPDDYIVEKIFAPSRDGKASIPISLIKPKNLEQNGEGHVLLYGYGSYGISIDPGFNVPALSLVDRGFIYAIAHPRGSSTNGRSWYENGKFLKKENTFNDFIDSAKHLIKEKYTREKNIAIMGGSAGGLLMGAVTNQEPGLWGAVLALVPFVDVINTMLDESLPLTVTEYDEWGNPNQEQYFRYMHSYAPYENIQEQAYPPILATGGINDPRVGFWEPTKWVLRLREHQKSQSPILLKMEMGAGHQGPSGRYHYYQERASYYAFAIDTLTRKNMVE